jgi:uncharacterized membrane protein
VTRRFKASYLREFRWYRRSRLWVVPTAGAVTALLIAAASLSVDHYLITTDSGFPVFRGTPETARSILSLIATSMATLTALVLTIVAVVIQLATQALSPRAVRTFLQDAHSHITIGMFVTTFTYALVVLQQFDFNREPTEGFVASVSTTIAFVLAVVSLGLFISYADHIVHQARVTSIIDRIGKETRLAIEQEYPRADQAPPPVKGRIPDRPPDRVFDSVRNGVILEINIPRLLELASKCDAVVVMIPSVGDFIPTGARLLEVYGGKDAPLGALLDTVEFDAERSIVQDVPFGFRLLVDIAERALSTGVNDPTTATQVVDQLHDLLRLLGSRHFPSGWHADKKGKPRLYVPLPTWDIYVALAFEEIRHHGSTSMQVVRRVRSLVESLLKDLPEERHPALQRQLRILDKIAAESFPYEDERKAARYADAQGIGSGPGFEPSRGDGQDAPHPPRPDDAGDPTEPVH